MFVRNRYILRFDGDEDRREFWKKAYSNENLLAFVKKLLPLLLGQHSQLLLPTPWGPRA